MPGPEHILEAGAEPHQEDAPDKEEKKTQKDENTLSKEQSTPVAEDDVVVLYVGVDDL